MDANLIAKRHYLHQHPELSGLEFQTAKQIEKWLSDRPGIQLMTKVGGTGVLAIIDSGVVGPNVLLRCELDALPITEFNDFDYKSVHKNIAHKCGHDGHMAILIGVAEHLTEVEN